MNDISQQQRPSAVSQESQERQRRLRRRVLTDKMVAELPRRPQPYFQPDPELPKHGIRVRPTGPGAYTVITRDPFGKQRWTKVGSTAETPIAEARKIAREVIRRVEQGLPAFEPPKPKADGVAVVTAEWLKRHVDKNKLRSAAEYHRIVSKYIVPHWGERAFEEIRRSDIAKLLDHVEDNHGAHQADAVLSVLRMVGNCYRNRDDDYVSPFERIARRVAKQSRKRQHKLSDAEIKALWLAADRAGAFGALVQLLLLTAQRLEKVRTLCWRDIGPDGVWTISTAPREKGNAGALQLPKAALAIIERQPRIARNPYVFAGNSGGPRSFEHRHKLGLDKLSGVEGWRLHDLRRAARSLMSRAGVLNDHAELVLGHARPGVEGTYDLHRYDAEKADALRKLAALIERIVHGPPGGNVVALHEAVS
jgi:integrase